MRIFHIHLRVAKFIHLKFVNRFYGDWSFGAMAERLKKEVVIRMIKDTSYFNFNTTTIRVN